MKRWQGLILNEEGANRFAVWVASARGILRLWCQSVNWCLRCLFNDGRKLTELFESLFLLQVLHLLWHMMMTLSIGCKAVSRSIHLEWVVGAWAWFHEIDVSLFVITVESRAFCHLKVWSLIDWKVFYIQSREVMEVLRVLKTISLIVVVSLSAMLLTLVQSVRLHLDFFMRVPSRGSATEMCWEASDSSSSWLVALTSVVKNRPWLMRLLLMNASQGKLLLSYDILT